tara:strand:+ start:1286 stop:2806 length:1521 start_codon:yes stop_codon:yes gene_type:complete
MSKELLVKNSIVSVVQLLLTAVLTFIAVPIFIGKLGIELYGIWALVSVVGNLNVLTNLGLNNALVVFVSRQGKSKESDQDIVVTQIIVLGVIVILTGLAFFFNEFIINSILSVPSEFMVESLALFNFLIFSNGILLFGQTFTSIIDGLQKMYVTNSLQFIYSFIYWTGQIVVLSLGGRLYEVGLTAFIAALIWFLIVFVVAKRMWGAYNLRGIRINFKSIVKKQLAYGSKMYVSGLTGFLLEPLSKILLSKYVGVNSVAFFEIGLKIKAVVNGLLTKALSPLFPFIAKAKDDINLHEKLNDLSLKIKLLAIPIAFFIIFIIKIMLKLWLGDDNLDEVYVFVVTMSVSMILLSPSCLPIFHYLSTKNMAEKTIWIQLSGVCMNIIVFFMTYESIGLYAILISNTLAIITSNLLCTYYRGKYLNFSFIREKTYFYKISIMIIIILLPCLLIKYYLPLSIWEIPIFIVFISLGFVFSVRYLKLLNAEDVDRYFGSTNRVKSLLIKTFIA